MSVLTDTGVFYAHHDRDAERHAAAVAAMDAPLDGEFGWPYASNDVYDETATSTRRRTGSFKAVRTVVDRILGTRSFTGVFELLRVGRDDFEATVDVWTRCDDHDLSVIDTNLIAPCERYGVDAVLSSDSEFDGLVDRRDPIRF